MTNPTIPGRRVADLLDRIWDASQAVKAAQTFLLYSLGTDDFSRNTGPMNRSSLSVRMTAFTTAHAELQGLLEAAKTLDIPAATLAIATGTDRSAFWDEFDAWRDGASKETQV